MLGIFSTDDLKVLLIKISFSLLILLLFYFLSNQFDKFAPKVFKILLRLKSETIRTIFYESFAKPIIYIIRLTGIWIALYYMPFNIETSTFILGFSNKIFKIATIIFISLAAQNLISNIPILFSNVESKFNGLNKTITSFLSTFLKAIVVIFTIVILMNEFGYDMTGIITGLGLSGLTFALAAQDTASNFVSGLVILADKPFEIGDWISVGTMEGIVEEMNLRSCRIRTFDNALISVPNNKLSADSVTNWTKMNMRKTNIIIGLVYSTTKETLQNICNDIEANLKNMDGVKKDSILVRFDKFSRSSLDIKISYNSYFIPLSEHTALKEKVQYMVMDVVKNNNSDFAYNSITVYNP